MLAYLRLFRWPNLFVVALTQYLLRYAIILPILKVHNLEAGLSHFSFALLVLATLLITAAGYAINDYFDLRTDRINKPDKIVLGKSISRRKAILFHSFFNIAGIIIGTYVSVIAGHWPLIIIFFVIPLLLWLYSIRYKRRFLVGNIIVSILAAFVIAIVWMFEFQAMNLANPELNNAILNINFYVRFYALFAFLTTLVREIIKDVEDIKGDTRTGCKTIPVMAGISATKRLIILLLVIIIFFVLYVQIYLEKNDFNLLFGYLIFFVQLPLIYSIQKTISAMEKHDYTVLSKIAKFIMVGGVLTMLVFYFYIKEGFAVI
jgi:4-hydroxybenzoate polyprenyltransferase